MKIQRFQLLGHLLLPLVLAVSGCNAFPHLRNTEKSPPHKEESPPKKIEEPVVKKPEPAEKPLSATSRIAEQELGWGIRKYEEGEHKIAARNFQNALSSGLASSGDQVTAHKYLAFIYCGSGEKLACRGEFKEILKLNPRFNLTPAEAGHPIWGPVFREVKAEAPGKKKQKR